MLPDLPASVPDPSQPAEFRIFRQPETGGSVNLEKRYAILYTRKRSGGHLTPRKVPMTNQLYEVLLRRYENRDPEKPWVFWHTFWDNKSGQWKSGPYYDRHNIMRTLCKKAGVPYFRFHALRHSGASTRENNNVPTGAIQRILGHTNRSTTEIYLHVLDEAEREAIATFERARQKSQKVSHDSHTTGKGLQPPSL